MNDLFSQHDCGTSIKDFDDIYNTPNCGGAIVSLDDVLNAPGCDGNLSTLNGITGVLGYRVPVGKHICELDPVDQLKKNDLLLLSKKNKTDQLSSFKLKYGDLESRVFNDVLDGLSVKSMAYEEKENYSVSSHNHDFDYSRVKWIPNKKYIGENTKSILDIKITSKKTEVFDGSMRVPVMHSEIPPQPMIGTLKFMSVKTWSQLSGLENGSVQVDPYDSSGCIRDDFDGWVLANGTEIKNQLSALSAACQLFARNPNANKFSVPDISRFFIANPKVDLNFYDNAQNQYNVSKPQVGMASHMHQIEGINLTAEVVIDSDATDLKSYGGVNDVKVPGNPGFHNGNDKTRSVKGVAKVNTRSLSIPGLRMEETGDKAEEDINEDNQAYPEHNVFPVMIYIGGVTQAYFEKLAASQL